jgi:hypothetical protein
MKKIFKILISLFFLSSINLATNKPVKGEEGIPGLESVRRYVACAPAEMSCFTCSGYYAYAYRGLGDPSLCK